VRTDREVNPGRAWLLRLLHWSPTDAVAVVVGAFAVIAVLGNALLMQASRVDAPTASGAAARAKPASADTPTGAAHPRQVEPSGTASARGSGPAKITSAGPPVARSNPVAAGTIERPSASKRVVAVQRALAEFGYGQLKPTGIVDSETQAAIQKFERERKLPVTGQASERVLRELSALTGRAVE
jgi:hypothetical protein